jgi:uncharacterized membrane protein
MQALWLQFWQELHQPEYVHTLLLPIPIYGLAAGLFALVVGLLARSRSAQGAALLLIALCASAGWLVVHFGHLGYDRVYSMADGTAQKWLNWHQHLGDRFIWGLTATALLAIGALVGQWKAPRLHRIALPLTLLGAAASLVLVGFLAFVGGKIRHSEFRDGPPPAWADTSVDED